MAISWLAVLQSVPWSDVISNAPKVADGARKLWSTVAGKPDGTGAPPAGAATGSHAQAPSLAQLASRQAALEASLADLHAQMLASSELIKALAEQNTQLVRRAEVNRVRTLWLAGTTAVMAVALVAVVSAMVAWQTAGPAAGA